jgi:hypothetical protein
MARDATRDRERLANAGVAGQHEQGPPIVPRDGNARAVADTMLSGIESSLGDAARKSFEMLPQGQQFFSETQRRSLAQGEAQGEAKGRAEGEARSIVRVLERRGLSVSREQRKRILACADIATLERWLDVAVTASRTEELFA